MEDRLFINNIHGEQELSLDQAIELLSNIRVQFLPAPNAPEFPPGHEAASIDVS